MNTTTNEDDMTIAKVIACLIAIESQGNPNAVGDGGKAIGILQIHPVMVQEANRLSKQHFDLEDRKSPVKSIQMAKIYLKAMMNRGIKDPVSLARTWNGGPQGHKKSATLPYAAKFKKQYGKA